MIEAVTSARSASVSLLDGEVVVGLLDRRQHQLVDLDRLPEHRRRGHVGGLGGIDADLLPALVREPPVLAVVDELDVDGRRRRPDLLGGARRR